MKIILSFGLLFVFGCQQLSISENSTVTAQTSANVNKDVAASNIKTDANAPQTIKKNSQALLSAAWVNIVTLEKLQNPDASDSVWVNGKLEKADGGGKSPDSMKVDVMNCAGFLTSGELTKNTTYGWSFKIAADSLAKDAAAKFKQCAVAPDATEDAITDFVFAVAPSDRRRQEIKISATDTKSLFKELPANVKKRLNNPYNLSEKVRRKNILSLQTNDNWTDTDGDGKIDLVEISTACDHKSGETKCSSILHLINGKWSEIGYTEADDQ